MRLMIAAMTLALTTSLAHAADATCEAKAQGRVAAGCPKGRRAARLTASA